MPWASNTGSVSWRRRHCPVPRTLSAVQSFGPTVEFSEACEAAAVLSFALECLEKALIRVAHTDAPRPTENPAVPRDEARIQIKRDAKNQNPRSTVLIENSHQNPGVPSYTTGIQEYPVCRPESRIPPSRIQECPSTLPTIYPPQLNHLYRRHRCLYLRHNHGS